MILTWEQLSLLIHGAVRTQPVDGALYLRRFTAQQEQLCRAWSEAYLQRSLTTAGVCLEMNTDSRELTLRVRVGNAFRPDRYFCHSILIDGCRVAVLDGFVQPGEDGKEFEISLHLEEGRKRVQIHFPWSADSAIVMLRLTPGAVAEPVRYERSMLIFGDSVTQGYDAHYPENAYTVILARQLQACAVNKSIGGVKFHPPLAALADELEPEDILISYGGNDWHSAQRQQFEKDSLAFCAAVRQNYPKARLLVLTPIAMGARKRNEPVWYFDQLLSHLKNLEQRIDHLQVILSSDFVPQDPALFARDGVHPLDLAHAAHARGIAAELERLSVKQSSSL